MDIFKKEGVVLKFSDGIEVDVSGPLRKLHLHDGWYVAGEGCLYPVKDEEEAERFIEYKKNKREE